MSKRDRDLKQRLEELFSSPTEPEPIEAPPGSPEPAAAPTIETVATLAGQPDPGLLKTILDHLPLPVYIKDRDHKWTAANPAFCDLIGQPVGALLGHVDKEQDDDAWRLDDQVLETGHSDDVQDSTTAPDGSIHTRRVRRIPLSGSGNQIQYVLGVIEETIRPAAAAQDQSTLQAEITEQRQNLARFRAIVEAAPIPMLITRATDGKPLYVNARASDMFGVSQQDILYHTTPDFYYDPAERQKISALLNRDGQVLNYEVRLKRADGTPAWAMLSVQPMTLNDEAAMLSSFYDVSERKQTEEQLLKFKLGIERSTEAIFITDANGTIVYVNPAFEKTYGYTRAEAIGQTPRILKSGVISPEGYQHFWNTLLAKGTVSSEIINKAKDGRLVPVEGANSPILDEAGNIVGFLAMHHDVTDRKHAQAEIERSAQLMRTLINNIVDLVYIKNTKSEFIIANQPVARLAGIASPDELVGRTDFDLFPREEAAKFFADEQMVIQSGEPLVGSEEVATDPDGNQMWLSTTKVPFRDASGQIGGIVGVGRNITERRRAEAERDRLLAIEAKRALQLRTAAEISEAAASILNPDELLPFVVELIRERFDLYYVGLFLADESHQQAVLRAGTGEAGRQMLNANHQLAIGGASMIGRCVASGEARIALDVGDEAVRFNNPLLPLTRSEMALPLASRGQVTGALTIQSSQLAAFTPDNIATLQTMASQIAIAIDNAQLLGKFSRQTDELRTLNTIAKAVSQSLSIGELLRISLDATAQAIGFDSGLATLFDSDADRLEIIADENLPEPLLTKLKSSLQGTLCDYVYQSGQTLALGNLQSEVPIDVSSLVAFGLVSYAGLPLTYKDRTLGTLCMFSRKPTVLSAEKITLLQAIGQQVGIGVENARLFDQTQLARAQVESRLRELMFLQRVSQAVSSTLDLTRVLDALFTTLEQEMGFTHTALALFNPDADEVRTARASGTAAKMNGLVRRLSKMQDDILIDVARKGQLEVIDGWDDRFDRALFEREDHANLVRAFVPLRLRDESIGVLEVGYQRQLRAKITPEEARLLSGLADQVAIAVGNARLLERAELRTDELTALNELSQALTTRLSVNDVLNEVYQGTSRLLDTANFYIALYDAERNEVSFPINSTQSVIDKQITVMPADRGLTGYIIRTRKSVLIKENVSAWQEEMGIPRVGEAAHSWLGMPLIVGDQMIGVMAIQSYTAARVYNEHDRDVMTAIASQAAIALQNARLFEQTQKQATEAAAINEIIQGISQRVELTHVLETTYQHISRLVPLDAFVTAFYDEQAGAIQYPLIYDEGRRFEPRTGLMSADTYVGRTILSGEPLVISRTAEELAAASTSTDAMLGNVNRPSASLVFIPLKIEQRVVGVLSVQSYQIDAYTPEHINLLTRITNQVAVAIQNARLFEQTQQSLNEMDNLYRASAELNIARTYSDVLEAMCNHTRLGAGASSIRLHYFDRPWTAEQHPSQVEVLVRLHEQGMSAGTTRHTERLMAGADQLLQSTAPTFIEDITTDERLDDALRAYYRREMAAESAIFLPLVAGGRWLGYIHALYPHANHMTETELRRLTLVTTQAAVAVQNLRSIEENQQALAETERLYTASRRLASVQSLQDTVTAVAEVMQTPDINRAVLWTFERNERGEVVSATVSAGWHSGVGVPPLPIGTQLSFEMLRASRLILTTEPVFSNDTQRDTRIDPNSAALLRQQTIGAIAILPLWTGKKQFGAFLLESETPHEFVESEIRPYLSLTQQMSIAIENQQLFERTQRDAKREQTISAITGQIYSATDVKKLLQITAEELRRATGSARAVVRLGRVDLQSDGSAIQPVTSDEGVTPSHQKTGIIP